MLFDYQVPPKTATYEAWGNGAIDVMNVLPTGGGKTVLFCNIAAEVGVPAIAIAHRQELVAQAALAFNREHVPHSIIAPKELIKQTIRLEHETHGHSSYSARAPIRVAGVDTLIRQTASERWFADVGYVIQDEGHHQLRDNKWGRARLMFPNARGLAMTAHAVRGDNKGLGRKAAGFIDHLNVGPYGRQLINRGFLTDYRVICVGSDIDFNSVQIGPSGELNQVQLRAVTHASNRIVGDVVATYLKFAAGKLGFTFAVDKEEAIKIKNAYCAAGVPADVITDATPIVIRAKLMRKFRNRELLQLVSVDCLGEGVDVPAVEVVSFARRTASWQLMCQQFGRALRVMVDPRYWAHWGQYSDQERLAIIANSAKPKAIIIDHVGNITWHAERRRMPDSKQDYDLLGAERQFRHPDAVPMKYCINPECAQPYEAFYIGCPHCGTIPEPASRSSPELVEGDLVELDLKVLEAMRGEADRVMDAPMISPHFERHIQIAQMRRHHERFTGQTSLRATMMLWGGWQKHLGRTDREAQKLFYLRFGSDVLSVQSLGATAAGELETRIRADLERSNIVRAA